MQREGIRGHEGTVSIVHDVQIEQCEIQGIGFERDDAMSPKGGVEGIDANIGTDVHQNVVSREAIDPSQGFRLLARERSNALFGRPIVVTHRKEHFALVTNADLSLEEAFEDPIPQLCGLDADLRWELLEYIGASHRR